MGWLKKEELKGYMEKLRVILTKYKIKCMCGHVLEPNDLTFSVNYGDYWIYANCPQCSYAFNYEKILRQYNSLMKMEDK